MSFRLIPLYPLTIYFLFCFLQNFQTFLSLLFWLAPHLHSLFIFCLNLHFVSSSCLPYRYSSGSPMCPYKNQSVHAPSLPRNSLDVCFYVYLWSECALEAQRVGELVRRRRWPLKVWNLISWVSNVSSWGTCYPSQRLRCGSATVHFLSLHSRRGFAGISARFIQMIKQEKKTLMNLCLAVGGEWILVCRLLVNSFEIYHTLSGFERSRVWVKWGITSC